MRALPIIIGLISGNFFVQYILEMPNYIIAADRSFFQTVAILTFIFANRFIERDQ